jgi:hypothetical protein
VVARSTAKVNIWNRALARIGTLDFLDGETDNRIEALVCALHHDDIVNKVLENFAWPFARRQASISQVSGSTRTGWDYVYGLPSDCVTPLALLDTDERLELLSVDSRHAFDVMTDDAGDGQVLCTNLDSDEFEVLEYTGLITNISKWSGQFVDAVIWLLASELALALPKNAQLANAMFGAYQQSIAIARADALNARQTDLELDAPSVTCR